MNATPRSWLVPGTGLLLGLVCAASIHFSRGALVGRFSVLREKHDTYALPPPDQAVVMSLGYRSAVADLIYAHTLVAYGLHFGEKRRFEHAKDYLSTVMTLDPTFAQPYLYADTLLVLQPVPAREEDYLAARELLRRGTRALPYHQRLWFTAGQFLAYLAPTNLDDPKLAEEFRQEGAELLAKACELATDNANIPYHCISAASLLNKSGKRDALIQMLTRTLAVNDDPEVRENALAALSRWVGEDEHEAYQRRARAFDGEWQGDLPYVSKERLLLLGRRVGVYECAGPERAFEPECVHSWKSWSESLESRTSIP